MGCEVRDGLVNSVILLGPRLEVRGALGVEGVAGLHRGDGCVDLVQGRLEHLAVMAHALLDEHRMHGVVLEICAVVPDRLGVNMQFDALLRGVHRACLLLDAHPHVLVRGVADLEFAATLDGGRADGALPDGVVAGGGVHVDATNAHWSSSSTSSSAATRLPGALYFEPPGRCEEGTGESSDRTAWRA